MATKKVSRKPTGAHKRSERKEEKKLVTGFEVRALSEDKLLGIYSNVAIIKHTAREFALDFLLRIDDYNILSARVITSPQHAKEIHKVLGENIEKYEKQHGEIKL